MATELRGDFREERRVAQRLLLGRRRQPVEEVALKVAMIPSDPIAIEYGLLRQSAVRDAASWADGASAFAGGMIVSQGTKCNNCGMVSSDPRRVTKQCPA